MYPKIHRWIIGGIPNASQFPDKPWYDGHITMILMIFFFPMNYECLFLRLWHHPISILGWFHWDFHMDHGWWDWGTHGGLLNHFFGGPWGETPQSWGVPPVIIHIFVWVPFPWKPAFLKGSPPWKPPNPGILTGTPIFFGAVYKFP